MEEYVIAMPRSYRAAIMLLKKKKQLEEYQDDFIPNNGISKIQIQSPKDLSHLNQIAEDNNRLRPDDIAYAYATYTKLIDSGMWSDRAEKIAKEHMAKALESVGISKHFRYEIV